MPGKIEYGDNLHHLREMSAFSVDLVYLDPPFSSGRDYMIVVEESMAHEEAYKDTWTWDDEARRRLKELEGGGSTAQKVGRLLRSLWELFGGNGTLAYLVMMAPRLIELHRVLKPTGSLYLHCDPTASHYLKILLDAIFGPGNVRSEVIWKRTSAHNNAKCPGPIHDVIFFCTKSEKYTWNVVRHQIDEKTLRFDGIDEDGRKWTRGSLDAPGFRNGDSGKPWRGKDPSAGRHWAISGILAKEYEQVTGKRLEGTTQEKLDALDGAGLILWPQKEGGVPRYKKYVDQGPPLQDIWTDIAPLNANSEEKEDFEGQKPLKLLERIILASSNEGDLVLDPFLGSGTTAVAAERLKRNWVGLELTSKSGRLAQNRLDMEFGEGVYLISNCHPADAEHAKTLADENPYVFQCWVVNQLHGLPGPRGKDRGKDGTFWMKGFADNKSHEGLISVKGGAAGPGDVRDFRTVLRDSRATAGLFVAFRKHISAGMREEAALDGTFTSGFDDDSEAFDRIQIIAVEDLFNRSLRFGGARLPGFIEKPDYSETKQAVWRREEEAFNVMITLGE